MFTKICPHNFVICQNSPCGQVLLLPSQRLGSPAADDNFVALKIVMAIINRHLFLLMKVKTQKKCKKNCRIKSEILLDQ